MVSSRSSRCKADGCNEWAATGKDYCSTHLPDDERKIDGHEAASQPVPYDMFPEEREYEHVQLHAKSC